MGTQDSITLQPERPRNKKGPRQGRRRPGATTTQLPQSEVRASWRVCLTHRPVPHRTPQPQAAELGMRMREAAIRQQRRAMRRARAYYELIAAHNIQVAARAYLARKRAREQQNDAARVVQRHARGHLTRKNIASLVADAAAERELRQHMRQESIRLRKLALAKKQEEADAVGSQPRQPTAPDAGARPDVPARVRVSREEAEAARLMRRKQYEARRAAAATSMQRVVRGHKARRVRTVKAKERDAALALQRVVRGRTGRVQADQKAEALGRKPVLCVGQKIPVEGGGTEYAVTRVMWRRDRRRRLVVNSMKVGVLALRSWSACPPAHTCDARPAIATY